MNTEKPGVELANVLKKFAVESNTVAIIPIQEGLINHTWKVESGSDAFVLQKINTAVFKDPEALAENIDSIASFLAIKEPGYLFASPLKTVDGKNFYRHNEGSYYRLFPFIAGSHTKNSVENARQAYEAAKQFGKFTFILKNFNARQLNITIASFHDLELRYDEFLQSLKKGNATRIIAAAELITMLKEWSGIVDHFKKIKNDPAFKLRVTHHDTKISNVLFDKDDKGICVIDLDTLMPGYFISDVGDMIRTYLSPVTEEEQDVSKIKVRLDIYDAIIEGYMHSMKDELSEKEKQHFFYAGCFMIYMQALRFLTDHLNNDIYYEAAYPDHNYCRAANQAALLQQFMSLKNVIEKPVSIR